MRRGLYLCNSLSISWGFLFVHRLRLYSLFDENSSTVRSLQAVALPLTGNVCHAFLHGFNKTQAFSGAFDGHGGKHAVGFVAANLSRRVGCSRMKDGFLVEKMVLNPRRQDFCTAADGKVDKGGEEESDKGEKFRKKIDQLSELKRQMEELDKKYDSYFTVDYALDLARKGFKDSDDDEFVDSSDDVECLDSSDSDNSSSEISDDDYDS